MGVDFTGGCGEVCVEGSTGDVRGAMVRTDWSKAIHTQNKFAIYKIPSTLPLTNNPYSNMPIHVAPDPL